MYIQKTLLGTPNVSVPWGTLVYSWIKSNSRTHKQLPVAELLARLQDKVHSCDAQDGLSCLCSASRCIGFLRTDPSGAGLYLLSCLTSPLMKFCILSSLSLVWQCICHSSVWHCCVLICLQYPIHSNQGSDLIYLSLYC